MRRCRKIKKTDEALTELADSTGQREPRPPNSHRTAASI
jgi:hypothetical protein